MVLVVMVRRLGGYRRNDTLPSLFPFFLLFISIELKLTSFFFLLYLFIFLLFIFPSLFIYYVILCSINKLFLWEGVDMKMLRWFYFSL